MDEYYPDGSHVVCVRLSDLERWPIPGEHVVIERRDGVTDDFEATLKEFRVADGKAWLWPRSYDPAHQQPVQVSLPSMDGEVDFGDGEEVRVVALAIQALVRTPRPGPR